MAEIIIEKPDQKTPKTVQKSNKVIQVRILIHYMD